ncbi:MAG: hypothetical protein JNN13_08685 [Planctomycetes bacterium]|nr:hypothetical protein [Planctomycetota bacterium]
MALTEVHLAELLAMLRSPVTGFDCGTLCAPTNGGVPVCCHAETVLPVLYVAELALLQKRSDLWRRHVPQAADGGLRLRARPCDVFAVCKGHRSCERDNRSLACRSFPFEPYLDHDDRFAGLVFAFEYAPLCPLIAGEHDVLPVFVAECGAMWRRLFELDDDERRFYAGCSRTLRRQFGRFGAPIPVFTEQGVVPMPTRRRRGRRNSLAD